MKILVLLSGGLDSATCLGKAVCKVGKDNVAALSVFYGQKHKKERDAADKLAEHYGVPLYELDLSSIMQFSNCSLLSWSDDEIPHSTYDEQAKELDGMPVSTYVPFRNGLFLSTAASMGLSFGCDVIWYGAHADDMAGSAYPDCSLQFVEFMNLAISEGTAGQIKIEAPFVTKTKADIVAEGLKLGVPYELTWSCYEGGEEPCGKCATCIDRAKAFEANGVDDPAIKKPRLNRIPNTQGIREIYLYPVAITKCELGGDWYTNQMEIRFVPRECYPDYTEVRTWIQNNIDGKTLNIEDVVAEVRKFLVREYKPYMLTIKDHITGCATHFDVDVIG